MIDAESMVLEHSFTLVSLVLFWLMNSVGNLMSYRSSSKKDVHSHTHIQNCRWGFVPESHLKTPYS